MARKKMDFDRHYSRSLGFSASDKVYGQDGNWYDSEGNFVEEINPGQKPSVGSKVSEEPEVQNEAAARAEAILGDLGSGLDPVQVASRENAQAAAAEDLSDDA